MALLNLVEKALNIRAIYHHILAGNIANVETPNYKEKDIDFQRELEKRSTDVKSVDVMQKTDSEGENGTDGNTVNIEGQLVKLTENNLLFNSLVQVMTKKFSMMRYAINEGKR
jgi:flagellar basal-body rod protein FlgB